MRRVGGARSCADRWVISTSADSGISAWRKRGPHDVLSYHKPCALSVARSFPSSRRGFEPPRPVVRARARHPPARKNARHHRGNLCYMAIPKLLLFGTAGQTGGYV
jgi:hypothetical protein